MNRNDVGSERNTVLRPSGDRWRTALAAWGVPPEILAAAPADPFVIPPELFAPRHQRCSERARIRATEALGPAGTVLDVGCGSGAASLALVPPATSITGVDASAAMLESFERIAQHRGIDHTLVQGRWPDVAEQIGVHTVVIAHHLIYNVADIERFLVELTTHAAHQVVMEITRVHPQASLNLLWKHFHGIDRPPSPTLDDLVEVMRDLGLAPVVDVVLRPEPEAPIDRAQLVEFTRTRLCLTDQTDEEIDQILPFDFTVPPREVACLTWAGGGAP